MCAMCAMCNRRFEANPQGSHGAKGKARGNSLEADCTLGEVFLRGQANTGNPALSLGIEALEDAEAVLLLSQLSWSEALELLAKVIPAYLNIGTVEKEEDMFGLILNSVELGSTSGISFFREAYTLSKVRH